MVTLFLNVILGVCVCTGGEFIDYNYIVFAGMIMKLI
jgi:hypothetical protein